VPGNEPYPGYQDIGNRLRKFFGIPGVAENVGVAPVVIAANIEPPNIPMPFFSAAVGVSAELASVGLGCNSLLFGEGTLEISDVYVSTPDTSIFVKIQDTYGVGAAWDSNNALLTARAMQFGMVPGVFRVADSTTAGQTGASIMSGLLILTPDDWLRIPGTYQLTAGSAFYIQAGTVQKSMRIMGHARVIEK